MRNVTGPILNTAVKKKLAIRDSSGKDKGAKVHFSVAMKLFTRHLV